MLFPRLKSATFTQSSSSPSHILYQHPVQSSKDEILSILREKRDGSSMFDEGVAERLEKAFQASSAFNYDEEEHILKTFVSLARNDDFFFDVNALKKTITLFFRYFHLTSSFDVNLLQLLYSKSVQDNPGIFYFITDYTCNYRSKTNRIFFSNLIAAITDGVFDHAKSCFVRCIEFISIAAQDAFMRKDIPMQDEIFNLFEENRFDGRPKIAEVILNAALRTFCSGRNVIAQEKFLILIKNKKFDISEQRILEKIVAIANHSFDHSQLLIWIFDLIEMESFGNRPEILSYLFEKFQEKIHRIPGVQHQLKFIELVQKDRFGLEKSTLESIAMKMILLEWNLDDDMILENLISLILSKKEISYFLINAASVFSFSEVSQIILRTCFDFLSSIDSSSNPEDQKFSQWMHQNLNWIQNPITSDMLSGLTSVENSPFERFLFLIKIIHWKKEEVDSFFSSPESIQFLFEKNPENKKNYHLIAKGVFNIIQGIESKHISLSDNYLKIFSEMIKIDLGWFSETSSIDQFIHIKNPLLSNHNEKVHAELTSYKINSNLALDYQNKFNFCYKENLDISDIEKFNLMRFSIQNDISKIFKNCIQNIKKHNRLHINLIGLKEHCERHQNLIAWNTKTVHDFIDKIEKIDKEISKIPKKDVFFIYAFLDELKQFKVRLSHFLNLRKGYRFQIIQWNKNDSRTFFLGNHMGCCLALGNEKFYAMLQRRLDDAIVFHVVMDQDRNIPAAAIWLYFGKTEENEIYLVGNFVEIGVHYGSAEKEPMRKLIIDQLLKFSERYSREVGLPKDHFIVNDLNYGLNQNHFRGSKPIENIYLYDKIGGPYFNIPKTSLYAKTSAPESPLETLETTEHYYYLASLQSLKFYRVQSHE